MRSRALGKLRRRDLDLVLAVVAHALDAARTIAVITGNARDAIIIFAVRLGAVADLFAFRWIKSQLRADLVDHPLERDICQTVVGITAADIRMHAGKPHLLDAILTVLFAPKHRPERGALVIQ